MITEVYADGGVVGASRSDVGGVWAFCHVDEHGNRELERGGYVLPAYLWDKEPGYDPNSPFHSTVTSPVMELIALCRCIRALPAGWEGTVYTDCQSALQRVFQGASMRGVPQWMVLAQQKLRKHLGPNTKTVLLAGHPTKAELILGYKVKAEDMQKENPKRWPVSKHNKWCDDYCNQHKIIIEHCIQHPGYVSFDEPHPAGIDSLCPKCKLPIGSHPKLTPFPPHREYQDLRIVCDGTLALL